MSLTSRKCLYPSISITCYSRTVQVLALLIVIIPLTTCKPFSNQSFLQNDPKCLLGQTIKSMSVFVAISNFELGNVNYSFEFSSNFSIPYIYGNQEAENADKSNIVGWNMKKDLKVKDKFLYLKAEYVTPCLGEDFWGQRDDNSWPQDPTIRVDVNSKPLFQASFQPLIIDLPEACSEEGKSAKKVVIEKVNFSGNPTFEEHRKSCNT